MNYKWLSLILGIICIVLGINFYRLQKYANKITEVNCPDASELGNLRMEKAKWLEREDQFLKENGALVTENNELKMQLKNKPLIIYRNVQKQKVNDVASQSYTDALQQRYSPNH